MALIVAAALLFVGSTTSALAACTGPNASHVEDCNGTVPSAVFTAPGVTTLNVNSLTSNPSQISLTGTGSSPTPPAEVQHYTCSGGNPANCTITPGTPASPGHPATAETCAVVNGAPPGTICVAPPATAAGGPSGNSGPSLTVNYNQPGANPSVAGSGAVVATGTIGVVGASNGSRGGNGSNGYVFSNGGNGGNGADGGIVTVNVTGAVTTTNNCVLPTACANAGIVASSVGGDGGDGGDAKGISGNAGNGGLGGVGGNATANFNGGSVETFGNYSAGVIAISQGGHGGNGGGGGGLVFNPGGGSPAGSGGNANVFTGVNTTIVTHGIYSHGIVAQSIGGGGGGSAGGFGLFSSSGGGGGNGGNGGIVQVTSNSAITTWGNNSQGILAQTIGGGGGDGGSNFGLFASGGSGSLGGNGGPANVVTVGVTNSGAIVTHGQESNGILAQSIGGGGGNGGSSGGLVSLGGSGSSTTNGGIVQVTNTAAGSIFTDGKQSAGIFAQSVGGGGGNGGVSGGLFSAGGSGGAGGSGALVTVTNAGDIETGLLATQFGHTSADAINSAGIFAQSVGGGGGNGGGAFSGGVGFSVSLGGSGGRGGAAGAVEVLRDANNTAYDIITHGDQSDAVFAQSIGGGGGNGGFAVSAAAGALALATGGNAADGAKGSTVTVQTAGTLTTYGAGSRGIFAQSIGGGGGNGGASIAIAANSTGFAAAIAIGGTGGKGGDADVVTVSSLSDISTAGDNAQGIVAQSVGGGGGNGGYSIGGAVGGIGLAVSIGGKGASGGAGKDVILGSSGSIHTQGDNSTGILAQSIGGGGGNGGFSVSASLGAAAASVGLGGAGSEGSSAGNVLLNTDGAGHTITKAGYAGTWNLITEGKNAAGVQAESIGGGGGNGGFAGSLSLGGVASAGVSLGGTGAGGGSAGTVTVNNGKKVGNVVTQNSILTIDDNSIGILAQSIGGGGGNGGFAIAVSGSGSFEGAGGSAAVSIGGKGAGGGVGMDVTVTNYGNIATYGKQSAGILAQSLGGGGGNGGFSVAGAFTTGAFGASVAIGGGGGTGNDGAPVTVTSTGNIETHGDQSAGILAQSVGGGGGNGGFAGAGTITLQGVAVAVGLGGNGAGGGSAKTVKVTSTGDITTYGDQSIGILAQSVGGGGGNGGSTVSLALAKDAGVAVGLGGKGGAAGNGLDVTVISTGNISTGAGFTSGVRGTGAAGILAQSVGGGGGNGGFAGSLGGGKSIAVGVSLGGDGAGGGSADIVKVTSTGNISTNFDNSSGIIAQSIGGGGGNGGFAVAVSGAIGDPDAATAAVAIGGKGGVGGVGKDVTVISTGGIITTGKFSNGILAQSVGGGGGTGGFAIAGSATTGNAGIGVGVGGKGATGSTSGKVVVNSYSLLDANGNPLLQAPAANVVSIWTKGDDSSGIFAQSVGGGGGSGGFAGSLGVGLGGGGLGVSIGGGSGSGSHAETVTVTSYNNILTEGKDSFGILAQSIGGGGGNGGFAIALAGSKDMAASVAVGGSGSSGGNAAVVTVTSTGNIKTTGDGSHAIFAQSVGGGGGNGGGAVAGTLTGPGTGSLAVGVGGSGASGGDGKAVTVTSTGDIRTEGLKADGILAQSVGGGGGNGGFTGALSISTGDGAVSVGVGGSGAGGGSAEAVTATSTGNIVTLKNGSNGILAQSVGGGGGNGGAAVTIAGAGKKGSAAVSVGGKGGGGGISKLVTVNNIGTIDTTGNQANGILAQSIGGGGGNGGFAISGNMTVDGTGGASVSVGGGGGIGQNAGKVIVNSNIGTTLANNTATIHTVGGDSNGIFAQSVGGGGGNGGFSGAVSVTGPNAKAAIGVSVGGSGAGSGKGETVNVTSVDNILTTGNGSNGILAQSVGGGGGNGGFSFAAAINGTLGKSQGTKGAISVALGGDAGSGGNAEKVTVDSTGIIQTGGNKAFGVLAQSIGGGGGTGGLSVSASLSLGENGNQITASVGGDGGGGGTGGEVLLTRHGSTITTGDQSIGLFAQSVGGSGGNGGMAISGIIAGTDAKSLAASVGGFGGAGTNSSKVTIDNTGAISTYGVESHAIQAQSIGGGGGNGGMAVSAVIGSLGNGKNFNVGVTVGGFGGDSGFAGDVFVTNHGLLQTGLLAAGQTKTNGDGAYGIFAQSIGGGGGSGGNAITGVLGVNGNNQGTQVNVSVAVGGAAGDGNKGGNVTIRQYGGIETNGVGAFGILAQSIGGGGGTGGRANSISLQLGAKCTLPKVCEPAGGKPGWNLQGVVGGAGGTGNDALTVDVANYDFITTHGDKSSGIVAQSIGGGGGIGGDAYIGTGGLLAIPYLETIDPTLLLKPLGTASLTRSGAVAIGGNGAGGGNGGTVIVTNEGVITTHGTKSDGIHAQSIGGGGGDGGDGQAGALGTVGIGGKGKAAGNGGSVTVTNGKTDLSQAGTAIIETFGTSPTPPAEGAPSTDPEQGFSAGIFAQSVGGGGGSGGGAGGLISVGGGGKAGGTGGLVTVNNYGGILTHADDSVGIFAQSIGGGGGAGGSLGISAIAVGGSGGSSGAGGTVNVTNSAMIETHGIDSYAIQAQSVGGGGGSGGGKNGGITGSIPAIVSIGGAGGSSGIGGVVTVINNNSLHTYGAGADGINAQSIGGGGGNGGRAIGFIAVGGKGGDTGNGTNDGSHGGGGAVTVTNNALGTITVEGVGAHGIFAQSIGAGGGNGGGGIGASIVPTSVGVGGGGGSSGDGGVVTVNNHGDITTVSASSVAIFAQSIGGGGGNGAMSIAAALSPGALTFGVGGDGGANGKGGNVNVTNFSDGFIHTKGFGSTGIMAQSVGGGGGNGGASYSVAGGGPGFSLALGGKGAAGGDGGVVTVINNGQMQLDGANSVAIFAQSVGGGGGTGGTAIAATIGPPVFIGGDSGAVGKGGDVTVTNTGVIVLKGNGSVGIFAQSVGGGGGVVTAGTDGIIQAVSGGTGNGGTVTINSNVAMLITGDNSVGVFGQSVGGGGGVGGFSGNLLGLSQTPSNSFAAMVAGPQGFSGSAGGAGTGGSVTFEQTANLYVTGKNSSGLMEQSSGGSGDIADNGDINVTIAKDVMIIGGSGAGAGVSYLDGKDNVLTNKGFVGAVTGADGCIPGVDAGCVRKIDGYAMRGGIGNDTFNNFYDTMGSIALGEGKNAFNNQKDAIYRMGDTVDLGLTGKFGNDGYVAPGDLDRVMTTNVTGDWKQSVTGSYLLDLDLDPEADRINVSGAADLNGFVVINIMDPAAATPGSQKFLILHADGGVTDNGLKLNAVPSAVAQYELQYPDLNNVFLNVDINFARTGLTQNQTAVGGAVNAIQTDLSSPAFRKIAEALFYVPTLDQLGAVYDSISGEGVSGFEQPQFDAYDTFLASMNRQSDFWRTGLGTDPMDRTLTPQAYDEPKAKTDAFKALQKAPDERRWSYWATAGGNTGSLAGDPVVGSAENVYKGGNFAAGFDSVNDQDVLMGFALGGAAASFAVPDRATTGNIIGAQAGAYLARKWDHFYINGALAIGLYNNDIDRDASVPGSNSPLNPVAGVSTESWNSNFLSAGFGTSVEAGWRQTVGAGAITPFAGVQFSMLSMQGFDETSSNGSALGLSFDSRAITSLPVSLGLQLDTTIGLGEDKSLQAWGRAAWVHEFETDRSVKPSFLAAPGYPFVIQGAAAAEDAVSVNAGLKMNWSSNTSMFATFDGKFGEGVQTYGGNVGLKLNW